MTENIEENVEVKPKKRPLKALALGMAFTLVCACILTSLPGSVNLVMNVSAAGAYGVDTHIAQINLYTDADNDDGTSRTLLAQFNATGGSDIIAEDAHLDAFAIVCHMGSDMNSFLTTNGFTIYDGTQAILSIKAPDNNVTTYTCVNNAGNDPLFSDLGGGVTQLLYLSVNTVQNNDLNYVFTQEGTYEFTVTWNSLQ